MQAESGEASTLLHSSMTSQPVCEGRIRPSVCFNISLRENNQMNTLTSFIQSLNEHHNVIVFPA